MYVWIKTPILTYTMTRSLSIHFGQSLRSHPYFVFTYITQACMSLRRSTMRTVAKPRVVAQLFHHELE